MSAEDRKIETVGSGTVSPPRTPREIWERVSAHLLRQGRRATRDGGYHGCMYRGRDGTSCAVGCLIPDEAYDPDMEDAAVTQLDVTPEGWWTPDVWHTGQLKRRRALAHALEASGIPATEENRTTLIDLQRIHDLVVPEEWELRLREGLERLAP